MKYEFELQRDNKGLSQKDALEMRIGELVQAGNLCLKKWLVAPALVLMFSLIDFMAGLDKDFEGKSVHERFECWIEKFFPKSADLPCTATDIYGARCGLVHSYSSESRLVEEGAAKEVWYALHAEEAEALERARVGAGLDDVVVMAVEPFAQALTRATLAFLADIERNPERGRWARSKVGNCLVLWTREGDEVVPFPKDLSDLENLAKETREEDTGEE